MGLAELIVVPHGESTANVAREQADVSGVSHGVRSPTIGNTGLTRPDRDEGPRSWHVAR